MMKIGYFLFLSCFFARYTTYGQCTADAGDSATILCSLDTVVLGGNPTASGGTAPYTYEWSMRYVPFQGSPIIFYASHFLADTTAANPNIVNGVLNDQKIWLKLKITDANDCMARDSTLLHFSQYFMALGYITYTINQGDSIYLTNGTNILGGVPPYSYLWRPNRGLIDSTNKFFWAAPDSSVRYYVRVTDSLGCVITGSPFYNIMVHTLTVQDHFLNNKISIYPNPTNGIVRVEKGKLEIEKIEIFNALGQKIEEVPGDASIIDLSERPAGLYQLIFKADDGVASKSVLKR